tara:strand:+ start:67 stop:639 length:573 start_codon:yes stop_codon:yes gene_type:complete
VSFWIDRDSYSFRGYNFEDISHMYNIAKDMGTLSPSKTVGIVIINNPSEITIILGLNQLYIPLASPIILDNRRDEIRMIAMTVIVENPRAKLMISEKSYCALTLSNLDRLSENSTIFGTAHTHIPSIDIGRKKQFITNINLIGNISVGYSPGLENRYIKKEKIGITVTSPIMIENDHFTSIQLNGAYMER